MPTRPRRPAALRGTVTAALQCLPLLAATAGCTTADDTGRNAAPGKVAVPRPGVEFDYQLGGASTPPNTAGALVRDRSEKPVPGLYNVCYQGSCAVHRASARR
ncbi:hypothetical protein [Streptomyces sp. NPDC056600]|uniref:hypothetical protein n=1 Tax=Streptomyces sp. NPDC056600 TaxID=3345874 RepID=UPI0036AD9AB1